MEGKKPQLSDLRESGAIEQDADMVCFIHRPEYYHLYSDDKTGKDLRGLGQIIVAKHRNGATDEIWLRFRNKFAKFQNEDDLYDDSDTTPLPQPGEVSIKSSMRPGQGGMGGAAGYPLGGGYADGAGLDSDSARLDSDAPPF